MRKEEKFDLDLRDLIRDAEVKAPSGVWKAVSARLDDIQGVSEERDAHKTGWRWAWAALAMAALAIALVFTWNIDRQLPPSGQAVALIEQTEEVLPVAVAEPVVPSGMVKMVCAPVAGSVSVPVSESVPVPVAEPVSAPVSEPAPIPAEEPSQSADVAEPWTDPFAETEVRRTRTPAFDFSAGVSASGNGKVDAGLSSYTSGVSGVSSKDNIYEMSTSVYGIPFSIGVGVRYHFSSKLSLGSGVDWSLLTRSFTGTYQPAGSSAGISGDVFHTLHYVGVPLSVYYDFLESSILRLYAHAGGEAEFCVSNAYRLVSAGKEYNIKEKVDHPQFSVGAGIGLEFKMGSLVSIYIDPGAYYYFYSQQPKSIRTDRPFNFNIDAGVRFSFR